jgi:hypothetical protein
MTRTPSGVKKRIGGLQMKFVPNSRHLPESLAQDHARKPQYGSSTSSGAQYLINGLDCLDSPSMAVSWTDDAEAFHWRVVLKFSIQAVITHSRAKLRIRWLLCIDPSSRTVIACDSLRIPPSCVVFFDAVLRMSCGITQVGSFFKSDEPPRLLVLADVDNGRSFRPSVTTFIRHAHDHVCWSYTLAGGP